MMRLLVIKDLISIKECVVPIIPLFFRYLNLTILNYKVTINSTKLSLKLGAFFVSKPWCFIKEILFTELGKL